MILFIPSCLYLQTLNFPKYCWLFHLSACNIDLRFHLCLSQDIESTGVFFFAFLWTPETVWFSPCIPGVDVKHKCCLPRIVNLFVIHTNFCWHLQFCLKALVGKKLVLLSTLLYKLGVFTGKPFSGSGTLPLTCS